VAAFIEFHAGDAKRIGAAHAAGRDVAAIAAASVELEFSFADADFVTLTNAVAELLGRKAPRFRDCLGEGVDGGASRALAQPIATEWVELFASLPPSRVEALAAGWLLRCATERPPGPGDRALPRWTESLKGITHVCRVARSNGLAVTRIYYY
jgi:hypothetical protein